MSKMNLIKIANLYENGYNMLVFRKAVKAIWKEYVDKRCFGKHGEQEKGIADKYGRQGK